MSIHQITIVGTGHIGGSVALAFKKGGFRAPVVGCDRDDVLAKARAMGAIDAGSHDLALAVKGSDVVVLATPVGAILDLLERVAPLLPPDTLITDVGSTKREVVERSRKVLGLTAPQRFLGGHPMAGRERSGIEQADPDLFQGAVWLVTPQEGQKLDGGRIAEYLKLVESTGSRVLPIGLEEHDRVCAWVSHLPQMTAVALAAALEDEFGDDPAVRAIGGRALREMTRVAASPYSMWRDVALTNADNLSLALQRLEQRLAHIRENLKTVELREEFDKGNQFREKS